MTGGPAAADRTTPALFETSAVTIGVTADQRYEPIAQLGAGPDGVAVLARASSTGDLVELRQLACITTDSPRWAEIRDRLRVIAGLRHPVVRAVLQIDETDANPTLLLEGDAGPVLAELIEAGANDVARAAAIVGQLADAIAAVHRLGIHHGNLHPLSVQLAQNDRPSIELTGTRTFAVDDLALARACRAPELAREAADASTDVFALGAMLQLLTRPAGGGSATVAVSGVGDLLGGAADAPRAVTAMTGVVARLIGDATQADRDLRPSAADIARQLGEVTEGARPAPGHREVARASAGLVLGRYELERGLGVGGMGEVWQARDVARGTTVAIKILKPDLSSHAEVVQRFRKEARVLAAVESPYIANLLDVNEDRGLHYLVLEYVPGGSVAMALKRTGKLREEVALDITANACRALAEPHRRGIVHRDVKPDNMMFVTEPDADPGPEGQRIKLGDFGIARAVEVDHTQHLTRDGAVLGTPEFMAPEQCQGKPVTAATDVYALGVTLWAMLVGHPPFTADTPMGVIMKHLHDQPPRVADLVPEISPATSDLVAQAMDKDPTRRHGDAAELLAAIEALRHGTVALITAHPAPPVVAERRIQTYRFEWELAASPEQLWPYVSNTEKVNRAAKLAPVKFEVTGLEPGAAEVHGRNRAAGLALRWREHPYEWVEGVRHVVLRVFDKGVLRWYVASLELERLPGGGTRLINSVRLEPRGWIARIVSRWELGVRYRKNLDKIYRRLDAMIAASDRRADVDPLQPEVAVPAAARARLEQLGEELAGDAVPPAVADGLAGFLLHASDQDVARIRPLELAARLALPPEAMIEACLRATQRGALVMLWDVVCPSCRIPSDVTESLQKISEHAHCKACNLEFAVDMSRAVELFFRVHPGLREVELRTFCIGGPAHFPHIVAQVRLAPGERFALTLRLAAGRYHVKSPQLGTARELRISATGGVRRCDVVLGVEAEPAVLVAGDQLLTLVNHHPREVLVRVERAGDREHALTAAKAMTVAAFRAQFPDQVLAPGRLLSITQNVLLVAVLDDAAAVFRRLGDARGFGLALRWFDLISTITTQHGGAVVKTFGGLVVAAFSSPAAAVEAALAIQPAVDREPTCDGLTCKLAVHQGAMMVLTVSGQLDYFGQNVELALELPAHLPAGTLGVTPAVLQDRQVQALIAAHPTGARGHRVCTVGRTFATVVDLPRATGDRR